MEERDIAIQITGLKKRYRLGTIGGGTLRGDLQSWWARVRKKEDPNKKIGSTTYGKNETFMALDGIDLIVYKGERLGIIGHNGAGKSTLLKLLSRVTGPTEGEICLDGRISSMLEVGTGFNPELTGRENVYLNGAILGMTKAEIDSKLEDIIDFSEVRQFIDTPVKRYSSGMYVKLAFAVASHLDSEILIMDEVLAVGDMAFQKKCLDKMSQVSQDEGRTILYVSHNMNTIRQLCDRCIVMEKGKIIFNGNVEQATDMYFDMKAVNDYFIDYNERSDLRISKSKKLSLKYVKFLNKENCLFNREEKQNILFQWHNESKLENLSLRVEILRRDGTPIGTSFLNDFYSGESGQDAEIKMELDISCLVSGRYSTRYTFFYKDQFGRYVNLENLNGLNFDVAAKENDIIWDRKNWGSVELPQIKVI